MLNIERMFLSVLTLKCMFAMIITNPNHDLDASQEPFHGNLVEKMLKNDENLNVTYLLNDWDGKSGRSFIKLTIHGSLTGQLKRPKVDGLWKWRVHRSRKSIFHESPIWRQWPYSFAQDKRTISCSTRIVRTSCPEMLQINTKWLNGYYGSLRDDMLSVVLSDKPHQLQLWQVK